MAKVCTVLSRSSGEGALRLLAALRSKVTPEQWAQAREWWETSPEPGFQWVMDRKMWTRCC